MEQTEKNTQGEVQISPSDLLDLLSGAVIATGKDKSLPTLTGVYLQSFDRDSNGGGLSATATDRYRLITGQTHYKGDAFTALVPNVNIEEVIRALKPVVKEHDKRAITISRHDNMVTFILPNATLNYRVLDATFPPFEYLLEKETTPSSIMGFNCELLGDFAKIPTGQKKGSAPVVFTFHGDSNLVTISVSHPVITWRGGVMPMRTK